MNFVTRSIFELQETTLMTARAVGGVFKGPRYLSEAIAQMDVIGLVILGLQSENRVPCRIRTGNQRKPTLRLGSGDRGDGQQDNNRNA